ncbi:MAG: PucR family transcriptional regulator [Proteocatella sp.]
MITVSDIIKNTCLKNYPVICGLNGLQNEVFKTGIIDYEFSIEGFIDDNEPFLRGEFLLSSLMFCHKDDEKLMSMLEKLVELGVSGLAVKNIFFKIIPEPAIDFCNAHNFPIILFDNEIYFEDIVNDIDNLLQVSDWINKAEHQISILLDRDLSRYEVEGIANDIELGKLEYVVAYWLSPKKITSQIQMKNIVKNYSRNNKRDKQSFLFKYRQNYVILITSNKYEDKNLDSRLQGLLHQTGISQENYNIGISRVHNRISELDFSIKESNWSCKVSRLLGEDIKRYSDIGTWAVVTANHKSRYMTEFMKTYLKSILNDSSEGSRSLLETLIEFVKCGGNSKLAAQKLNIHDNTFRYRINKIREKIDPNSNDYIFFENVSLAIKIYLLESIDIG